MSLIIGNTLNKKKVEVGLNNNFLIALSKKTQDVSKKSLTIDINLEKSNKLIETTKELP